MSVKSVLPMCLAVSPPPLLSMHPCLSPAKSPDKRYTYLVYQKIYLFGIYQVLIYQIGISQLHTIQGPPKTSDIAIDLSKCTL